MFLVLRNIKKSLFLSAFIIWLHYKNYVDVYEIYRCESHILSSSSPVYIYLEYKRYFFYTFEIEIVFFWVVFLNIPFSSYSVSISDSNCCFSPIACLSAVFCKFLNNGHLVLSTLCPCFWHLMQESGLGHSLLCVRFEMFMKFSDLPVPLHLFVVNPGSRQRKHLETSILFLTLHCSQSM